MLIKQISKGFLIILNYWILKIMLGCIAVYFRRQVKQLNQSDVNFIVTLTSNSNPRSLLVSMSWPKFSDSKIMLHIIFYRIFPTLTHSFELNQQLIQQLLNISIFTFQLNVKPRFGLLRLRRFISLWTARFKRGRGLVYLSQTVIATKLD